MFVATDVDAAPDVRRHSYLLHLLSSEARRDVLLEAQRLLRRDATARNVVVTVWADRRRLGGRAIHAAFGTLARAPRRMGWPYALGRDG